MRKTDDGRHGDQHVDDLGGGGARIDRGIGLGSVGRDSPADRDQCGQPDQRQRLRIQLQRLDSGSADAVLRKLGVVDGKTAQPLL